MARPSRGYTVEVRDEDEILATREERGELEGLPFMPEMIRSVGGVRVAKRAMSCATPSMGWD